MKFVSVLLTGLAFSLVANAVEPNDGEESRYRDKVVDVQETPLSNGCVLVSVIRESKHGSLTRGVGTNEQFIACPQDTDEDSYGN